MAVDLASLEVPLHALDEVARLAGATVVLGAIFTPDPDATQGD